MLGAYFFPHKLATTKILDAEKIPHDSHCVILLADRPCQNTCTEINKNNYFVSFFIMSVDFLFKLRLVAVAFC